MLLNTAIFNQTVETAKAKSANNPAMLRAIERAVYEINRSKYWSIADGVLRIQSTTNRKLYVIDDAHTCEARTVCKHRVARRLMQRYTERLAGVSINRDEGSNRNERSRFNLSGDSEGDGDGRRHREGPPQHATELRFSRH